jgi:hypothetical protein
MIGGVEIRAGLPHPKSIKVTRSASEFLLAAFGEKARIIGAK